MSHLVLATSTWTLVWCAEVIGENLRVVAVLLQVFHFAWYLRRTDDLIRFIWILTSSHRQWHARRANQFHGQRIQAIIESFLLSRRLKQVLIISRELYCRRHFCVSQFAVASRMLQKVVGWLLTRRTHRLTNRCLFVGRSRRRSIVACNTYFCTRYFDFWVVWYFRFGWRQIFDRLRIGVANFGRLHQVSCEISNLKWGGKMRNVLTRNTLEKMIF